MFQVIKSQLPPDEINFCFPGLGTHGLTADSAGTLISLHVAMKNELQRHVDVYKQALHKLEELVSFVIMAFLTAVSPDDIVTGRRYMKDRPCIH